MNTVTCHTVGCENEGVPLEMTLSGDDDGSGQPWAVTDVYCGPCGQPITDVTPPLSELPHYPNREATTDE